MFQLGGTIGALAVSWCMDRYNAHLSIAVSYLLGAAMLVAIAQLSNNRVSVNLVVLSATVFLAGFFMSGSQSSMSPLAAGFYPTLGRATGLRWMLGIGRFGAILGRAGRRSSQPGLGSSSSSSGCWLCRLRSRPSQCC